jgi:hypothetical protein
MASSIRVYHLDYGFHESGADIGPSENTSFSPASSLFLLALVFAKGENLD